MSIRSVLKLCREKRSILDVLSLYFVLAKLLGFIICTVTGDGIRTLDLRFEVDDLILYVAYLSVNLTLLYLGRLEAKDNSSIIVSFGTELVLIVSLVTGIISSSLMVLLRKRLLKILQLIHQYDTQISPLGVRFNYNREFSVFGAIVLATCFTVFGFIYLILVYEPRTRLVSVLSFVVSNLNFAVLMISLFIGLLGLRSRLQMFTECFWKHFGNGTKSSLQLGHLSTTSFSTSSVAVSAYKVNTSATGNELTINRFAVLYNLCCDLTELFNGCFGLQLMLFIGMCFVYSIFAIFGSFRLWYLGDDEDGHLFYSIFKQLIWTIYYYSFVLAIIAVSNSLTNTGKSCSILAYKAINLGHDPATMEKLRGFAQQVSNRIPVITCGLFTIDWTLFYTMVGASTTYLVILIQFDTSAANTAIVERLENLTRRYQRD